MTTVLNQNNFYIHIEYVKDLIRAMARIQLNVEHVTETGRYLSNSMIQSFVGSSEYEMEVNLSIPDPSVPIYDSSQKTITLNGGALPVRVNFPQSSYVIIDSNTPTINLIWNQRDKSWEITENLPIIPPVTNSQKLTLVDSRPGSISCKICSNLKTIAVGNPQAESGTGKLWIFERQDLSTDWIDGKVTSTPGVNLNENLGYSVGVSDNGQVVVVSATNYNTGDGRVYAVRKIDGVWTGPEIVYTGGVSGTEQAGKSLDVNGDGTRVIIGSPSFLGGGKVVVAKYINSTWTTQTVISAPINSVNFGSSVSISNDGLQIMIGDPNYDSGSGRIFVYDDTSNNYNSAGVWTEKFNRLGSALGSNVQEFGFSTDFVKNDIYVIGAPTSLNPTSNVTGKIFILSSVGSLKNEMLPVIETSPANFGYSVSINENGNVIAVGDPQYDGFKGKVELFARDSLSGIFQYSGAIFGSNISDKIGYDVSIKNGTLITNLSSNISGNSVIQIYG